MAFLSSNRAITTTSRSTRGSISNFSSGTIADRSANRQAVPWSSALRASGSANATLDAPARGGSYQAHVTAQTPEGRIVEDYGYFYISGGGLADFGPANNRNLQIDHRSRRHTPRGSTRAPRQSIVGQPYRHTGFASPSKVAISASVESCARRIPPSPTTSTLRMAMNCCITVNKRLLHPRNGDFYGGEKYIKVPPVEHQLNGSSAADRPQYLPGQTADYSLEVTDNARAVRQPKPSSASELSIEAIYGIRKDSTEDIVKFFFDREWNRVATDAVSITSSTARPESVACASPRCRPASRLAQLKPERVSSAQDPQSLPRYRPSGPPTSPGVPTQPRPCRK